MKLDINLTLFKFTAVAEAGKKGDDLTKLFFKEEYMLNYAIGELICISPPKNDLPVWNFFQKVFSFKYNCRCTFEELKVSFTLICYLRIPKRILLKLKDIMCMKYKVNDMQDWTFKLQWRNCYLVSVLHVWYKMQETDLMHT